MLTYFQIEFGAPETISAEYVVNEIFTHELRDDHILITTLHRAWAILTREEFELLLIHRIETMPEVYRALHNLGIIVTEENAEKVADTYRNRYLFMFEPPWLNILAPTNRCNMTCTYCHAEVGGVADRHLDMSEERVLQTIDFFFTIPKGVLHPWKTIEFQGGEPFLRYDLMQRAMDYALKKAQDQDIEVRFIVQTNLTLMSDEIAQDLKRRGNVSVSVSLDGPPHINDALRPYAGGKGTCGRVMYWVERLESRYGIKVPLQPTCTTRHLGHEEEVIDYFAARGRDFHARPGFRAGRAHSAGTYDELGFADGQAFAFVRQSLDYILERNKSGVSISEGFAKSLLRNMLSVGSDYMCRRRPCGAASSQLAVNQGGDIYTCDAGRSIELLKLGHVATHTYEEIVTSPTARNLRGVASETLPKCRTCAFNPYCAYCFVETVHVTGNPLPKIPMDHQCQLYIQTIPYLFEKLTHPEEAAILTRWAAS